MKSNRKLFLAVACLALAALSCQAVSNLAGRSDRNQLGQGGKRHKPVMSCCRMTFPPPAGGPAPMPTARWNMQTENCR